MSRATAKAIPAGKGKESIIVTYADGTTEEVRKAVPVGKYNAVSIVSFKGVATRWDEDNNPVPYVNEWTGGFPSKDLPTAMKNKGGMKANAPYSSRERAEKAAEMMDCKVMFTRKNGKSTFTVANQISNYAIEITR